MTKLYKIAALETATGREVTLQELGTSVEDVKSFMARSFSHLTVISVKYEAPVCIHLEYETCIVQQPFGGSFEDAWDHAEYLQQQDPNIINIDVREVC